MSALLVDTPAVEARFDRICAVVAAARRGLTLTELGQAHALARLLESQDTEAERVEEMAATLGVDVGAIR